MKSLIKILSAIAVVIGLGATGGCFRSTCYAYRESPPQQSSDHQEKRAELIEKAKREGKIDETTAKRAVEDLK